MCADSHVVVVERIFRQCREAISSAKSGYQKRTGNLCEEHRVFN